MAGLIIQHFADLRGRIQPWQLSSLRRISSDVLAHARSLMPRKCSECKKRPRADGSCRTAGCPMFLFRRTPEWRGRHWAHRRRERLLGRAADRVGVYVVGGSALTLLHRHDIRVGIACGMILKTFVPDRSRRIEMLAMLYPAYWRWSTRELVIAMHEHREEFAASGADAADSGAGAANRRADIYAAAWDKVEAKMRDKQVVGYRDEERVALLQRSEARQSIRERKGRFGYHPYSNPASRRTGASEARILLTDVRSGQLESVSKALDQLWAASGATYKHSQEVLMNQSISLWQRAGYNRIRFLRWLFKAEGMSVEIVPEEWDLLEGMGEGGKKGCEAAGIKSFDDAQAACAELRKLPAVSGATFDADDLIYWLCLSMHKESQAPSRAQLPAPAEPVTVDADLCLTFQGARTRLRRKVAHLPHAASGAVQEQKSRAQEAPRPPGAQGRLCGTPVLTAVLPELVRWLPVTDAGSMCQTCQGLLPALDATRARIADIVAKVVSLQGPLASTLLQAGLSSAEVLAMRAQAWTWLAQCNQDMLSSAECWQSIASGLLRLSAKFLLTPVHADICVRFLPQWPGLGSMECRLMSALWARRSNQAPHYRLEPPQPLPRPKPSRRWRGQLLKKTSD